MTAARGRTRASGRLRSSGGATAAAPTQPARGPSPRGAPARASTPGARVVRGPPQASPSPRGRHYLFYALRNRLHGGLCLEGLRRCIPQPRTPPLMRPGGRSPPAGGGGQAASAASSQLGLTCKEAIMYSYYRSAKTTTRCAATSIQAYMLVVLFLQEIFSALKLYTT